MKFLTVVVAVFAIATFALPWETASAQSLWQNRADKWANPVGDFRALRPGDLLVITIRENTDVQNRDQRQMNKATQQSSKAGGGFSLSGLFGTSKGEADADQSSSATRKFNGQSQNDIERVFTDKFTVTVLDVMPNGNLLVAGKRQLSVEGDAREIVLTGQVRPVDVKPDNSVASNFVADLKLQYESNDVGSESAFVNQGWLGRKMNKWLPF